MSAMKGQSIYGKQRKIIRSLCSDCFTDKYARSGLVRCEDCGGLLCPGCALRVRAHIFCRTGPFCGHGLKGTDCEQRALFFRSDSATVKESMVPGMRIL